MLPMGLSVGPVVGPNWVLVGDAAGAINPFNGEGIDYALETGRLAARRRRTAPWPPATWGCCRPTAATWTTASASTTASGGSSCGPWGGPG